MTEGIEWDNNQEDEKKVLDVEIEHFRRLIMIADIPNRKANLDRFKKFLVKYNQFIKAYG